MSRRGGFTLIELMLVIAIIVALAAIAIPKYSETIRHTQEARTLGNLALLRATIQMYYSDNEGHYPTDDLTSLTVDAKYIPEIPLKLTPPYHPEGNSVSAGPLSAINDSRGDWYYVNDVTDARFGSVVVNCSHTNLQGVIWTDQ